MIDTLDIKRNNISKKLAVLLPEIDPRVSWVEYIPRDALTTGQVLVAIGMINGCVKYIDVHKLSPFKLINKVMNAMDDYCPTVQFLNERQINAVSGDIALLAQDRAVVAKEALERIPELSDECCKRIVMKAQKDGVLPPFFPDNPDTYVTSKVLSDFLKSKEATFMDVQILSDLIKKELEKQLEAESLLER